MREAPALAIRNLTVRYQGAERPAIDKITVDIPVGSRVALVGANGSGKSTLLKAIAGLLMPSGGSFAVFGLPERTCHHRVAYLPQRNDLDWRFPISARGLTLGGRYVHLGWLRRPSQIDRDAADRALARLGLAQLADRQIGKLSSGQHQRVLLARALAQDADLYLLDEPLNAVDAETREIVTQVLDELRSAARTVLVATHDLGRFESSYDHAIYLSEGRQIDAPPGGFDPRHAHGYEALR